MKRLLIIAAVLVLAVNAWILIDVAYNRYGGEPELLVLNERELRLPYRTEPHQSVVRLSLQWQGNSITDDYRFYRQGISLTEESYALFGFTAPVCKGKVAVWNSDGKNTAAWVLLEFNGAAYRQLMADYEREIQTRQETLQNVSVDELESFNAGLQRLRDNYRRADVAGSRLIAVDAAIDRQRLVTAAEQSSASTLILPATISPGNGCVARQVTMRLQNISALYVPPAYRDVIQGKRPVNGYGDKFTPPRFTAEIGVGAKDYLWVKTLARCNGECQ